MAYPKRVNALNVGHQEKAILCHAGFVRYVVGKVNKVGIENTSKDPELKWLRKLYERVLDFAEALQLKAVPDKHEGSFEQKITVVFEKDNSENRIQAPRFAAPSLQ